MRQPFARITTRAARAAIPARPAYADELDAFLAGDLWRGGQGWIGELPTDADALTAMARGIVSENVLDEILFRAVAAVIGDEPRWALVMRDGGNAITDAARTETGERIRAIEAALTAWWDQRGILATLQQAAWHLGAEGRGPLYLTIPAGLRNDDGTIPRCETLAEALRYCYVDAKAPATAGVATDAATRLVVGVVAWRGTGGDRTDVTYLDEVGRAVLRVLDDGDKDIAAPFAADLGGHLFLHDRAARPILGRQVVQMQKALTLTLSQMMRNINLAGHRQVDYLNAEPPGHWTPTDAADPNAVHFPDGTYKRFVAAPILSGPGVRNFIQGNNIINEKGETVGVTNPNVSTVDPVSVDHFERTRAVFRAAALVQCHQGHVLLDNAAVSGISREQSRADFEASLGPLVAALDARVRWALESVLGLCAVLMGRPGLYSDLRAEASCRLSLGPLSPEEQEQIRANVAAGLLSVETAMAQLGTDDVGAERERIAQERTNQALAEQTNATAILGRAGLLAQEASEV